MADSYLRFTVKAVKDEVVLPAVTKEVENHSASIKDPDYSIVNMTV